MTVNFVVDRKGKKADNLKRIQIHGENPSSTAGQQQTNVETDCRSLTVVEAQGLSLKGSTKSPPAYVTIESPGLGTLHQTGTISKGRSLVWHENSRIVELKPSAQIRFIVKRQARWPITHNNVLGSTDTYNLCKLIEMQGKNDRETCKYLASCMRFSTLILDVVILEL
ncbi:hypothetical protein AX17_002573 [Amanita inopinata Kibby_2008]|nr:hypothetical protein AX17_002573 [Amanita inopinata Kibby_2008]